MHDDCLWHVPRSERGGSAQGRRHGCEAGVVLVKQEDSALAGKLRRVWRAAAVACCVPGEFVVGPTAALRPARSMDAALKLVAPLLTVCMAKRRPAYIFGEANASKWPASGSTFRRDVEL